MAGNLEISGVGDAVKQYGSLVLKILLIVVIVMVVWKVYKSVKTGASVVGEKAGEIIVEKQTGIPAARIQICKQVAEDLYNSYFYYLFDFAIDEEAWINAMNRLETSAEAVLMSQYFKEKSGRSIKTLAGGDFSTKERARVKPIIWNNLS